MLGLQAIRPSKFANFRTCPPPISSSSPCHTVDPQAYDSYDPAPQCHQSYRPYRLDTPQSPHVSIQVGEAGERLSPWPGSMMDSIHTRPPICSEKLCSSESHLPFSFASPIIVRPCPRLCFEARFFTMGRAMPERHPLPNRGAAAKRLVNPKTRGRKQSVTTLAPSLCPFSPFFYDNFQSLSY